MKVCHIIHKLANRDYWQGGFFNPPFLSLHLFFHGL